MRYSFVCWPCRRSQINAAHRKPHIQQLPPVMQCLSTHNDAAAITGGRPDVSGAVMLAAVMLTQSLQLPLTAAKLYLSVLIVCLIVCSNLSTQINVIQKSIHFIIVAVHILSENIRAVKSTLIYTTYKATVCDGFDLMCCYHELFIIGILSAVEFLSISESTKHLRNNYARYLLF